MKTRRTGGPVQGVQGWSQEGAGSNSQMASGELQVDGVSGCQFLFPLLGWNCAQEG